MEEVLTDTMYKCQFLICNFDVLWPICNGGGVAESTIWSSDLGKGFIIFLEVFAILIFN